MTILKKWIQLAEPWALILQINYSVTHILQFNFYIFFNFFLVVLQTTHALFHWSFVFLLYTEHSDTQIAEGHYFTIKNQTTSFGSENSIFRNIAF